MPKKTKAKKFRGINRTHGRGKKAGRGKGMKGGSGNAGMFKHRFTTTVLLEKELGRPVYGRHGFKRPQGTVVEHSVVNVRDLEDRFGGQKSVDLGEHGYTKLLGGGSVASAFMIKVKTASASAVRKIEAAGGKVTVEQGSEEPVAEKAAKEPAKAGNE
jgi:large subunit ribosomal protein L15